MDCDVDSDFDDDDEGEGAVFIGKVFMLILLIIGLLSSSVVDDDDAFCDNSGLLELLPDLLHHFLAGLEHLRGDRPRLAL